MNNHKRILNKQKFSIKVLIVEDDFFSALLIEEYLCHDNIITHKVTNGRDAVEYCRNNVIDLVLMDLNLPCMSGLEAVRMIKDNNPNLTVVAQTAYIMDSEIDKIIETDFDGYLLKPFKSNELIDVVMRETSKLSS